MQEKIKVLETVSVQVTRAPRTDWISIIAILFILAIIYFFYKRGGGKMNIKKLVISLIIGFVFMFIAFILSIGDNASIIIGLLVIYIELRFGDSLFKERRNKK